MLHLVVTEGGVRGRGRRGAPLSRRTGRRIIVAGILGNEDVVGVTYSAVLVCVRDVQMLPSGNVCYAAGLRGYTR